MVSTALRNYLTIHIEIRKTGFIANHVACTAASELNWNGGCGVFARHKTIITGIDNASATKMLTRLLECTTLDYQDTN